MSLLEVQDIHSFYGDSHILQGVNLKLDKGTLAVIVGKNGVGKTTLLHSIVGFILPRSGSIVFEGQDITQLGPFRTARLGISIIPQGRRIFNSLTVAEHIEIATHTQSRWTLDRILSLFPALKPCLHSVARTLSGGEQEMLAWARALVANPELLLMDEPTEGLAPLVVRSMEDVLKELKREGLCILLVEQNLSFALKVADYVYVMSKGTIVYESGMEGLSEDKLRSLYMGF